jgi:hypothetical protein
MQDEETAKVIKSGNELAFEKILYEKWGVEIGEPWQVLSCHHRPLEQSPETFNGPMVIGVERLDPEYIASGNASFEAQVAARDDISLMMDIKRIGRQGSSEKAFSSRDGAKRAIKQEMS